VRSFGGNADSLRAMCSAQASAAAAVLHQQGGTPCCQAAIRSHHHDAEAHCPILSVGTVMYGAIEVPCVQLVTLRSRRGATSHLNQPSAEWQGEGNRMTSKPRVRKVFARTWPICRNASSAFGGSGGQPSGGLVRAHSCLCSRVPGAAGQN
jgi:hypothetical protein